MESRKIIALSLCLVLALSLTLVIAEKDGVQNENDQKKTNEEAKMNYGKCTSDKTLVKKSCFKSAQETFKICREDIKQNVKNETLVNKTEIKNLKDNCRETLKESLKSCKADFKLSKENCKQYKCKVDETFFFNETTIKGSCIKNPLPENTP